MSFQHEKGYYWAKLVGDKEWRILEYAEQYDKFFMIGQFDMVKDDWIIDIWPIKLDPPEDV